MSILDRKASGDELLIIGFGMAALGMWFKEYYFLLGGCSLFLAGVMTLEPIGDEEDEGRQEEGGDLKPLGPPPS